MKKLLILACMGLMLSCNNIESNPATYQEVNQRIKGKTTFMFDGVTYQIIEVDEIEYISMYHGGLCPLVKQDVINDTICCVDTIIHDNISISK